MKVIAIDTPAAASDLKLLDDMHRLRARIFRDRLSWNVSCVDGREYDEFDRLAPTYIIALSSTARIVGCVRLLPATGPTMIQEVFPSLIEGGHLIAHPKMIESSRFCVDTNDKEGKAEGSLNRVTFLMFAGILEWCLANSYSELVTATDVRFERILRRAGWPMRRLGNPVTINETRSVGGLLPISSDIFDLLRPADYFSLRIDGHTRAA